MNQKEFSNKIHTLIEERFAWARPERGETVGVTQIEIEKIVYDLCDSFADFYEYHDLINLLLSLAYKAGEHAGMQKAELPVIKNFSELLREEVLAAVKMLNQLTEAPIKNCLDYYRKFDNFVVALDELNKYGKYYI